MTETDRQRLCYVEPALPSTDAAHSDAQLTALQAVLQNSDEGWPVDCLNDSQAVQQNSDESWPVDYPNDSQAVQQNSDEGWPVDCLNDSQAVQQNSDEGWPVDSLNDSQMGEMMDLSLLTSELLQNDATLCHTEQCLSAAPEGCNSQVVNGETTTWNVFQGLEVSQFQMVGSEEPTAIEAAVDGLATGLLSY